MVRRKAWAAAGLRAMPLIVGIAPLNRRSGKMPRGPAAESPWQAECGMNGPVRSAEVGIDGRKKHNRG